MTRQQRTPAFAPLLLALLLCACLLAACGQKHAGGTPTNAEDAATQQEAAAPAQELNYAQTFPSWAQGSASLAQLVAFVQDVTDESSDNYVAPEERIATFDMDGTLICEKAPVYVDYCLLMHRVFDDPTYDAPQEYLDLCTQLRANADQGILDDALDGAKNEALVSSFANMKPEEFRDYVNSFIDTEQAEGFDNMTYGESVYLPMKEVVDYLVANEFQVYIVSASEREVARAIGGSKLGIAPEHVIGTDYGTKATGQGDEAANRYTFDQDDELVFDGTKEIGVANLNKVIHIEREIGRRPILAFGNSSGDNAMLNYAQSNPDHKSLGLLVLCDDVEREYGNMERAASQAEEAAQEGWVTISMAKDWATIYGAGVVKTELRADAEELAEAA